MHQSTLTSGDNAITVHHQGAHLSSWLHKGREQLFLSRNAVFEPTKAIRGGVPICFPQFGAFGPGNSHGFARNVVWQPLETQHDNQLRFELSHNKASLEQWPYQFNAQFEIELNENTLTMSLSVENINAKKMEFTAALHTYFRVDHIKNAIIDGLQQCEFWDNGTEFSQRQHQEQHQLRVDNAIDRVYFNTPQSLKLTDNQSTRQITSNGFDDTVVWNPWASGAEAFIDMADDEYQQMLCIESANVQTPIELEAGATWQGVQKVTVTL